jgi:integrase
MALTVKRVIRLRRRGEPGRYHDAHGLYLVVTGPKSASWQLRYQLDHKARWMGLGPAATFTLDEARDRATSARKLLADKVDPLVARRADRAARKAADATVMTFRECAKTYIDSYRGGWKNAKHRQQWENTIETYCNPIIGDLDVAAVSTQHVLRILEQRVAAGKRQPAGTLWQTRRETASRVRGRLEAILAWATVRGSRSGDNPAKWANYLSKALPEDGQSATNHPALPFAEIPQFMARLRANKSVSARALEFAILTAGRTGAVIGARWSEINFDTRTWTVPPERAGTKIKITDDDPKPRRIPLSDRVVEILRDLPREDGNPHVFVGAKAGPLSNMAMAQLMKRFAAPSGTPGKIAVPHGFRSTFKDWVSETTNYPNFVSEAALWHAVADKVEAAYRRGDLFPKRRRLMADWARYCARQPAATVSDNVVPLHKG